MADFTKTISNGINVFGGGPSTIWGQAVYPYTMVWGSSLWGEGFSLIFSVQKVIDNSITPDTEIIKSPSKLISESTTLAFETSSEKLSQGVWDYIFPDNTSDAENRDFPTWTESSQSTISYVCGSVSDTTWT